MIQPTRSPLARPCGGFAPCGCQPGDAATADPRGERSMSVAAKFVDCTCLVTGGAGFIGSHLVHRLIRAGANVRVLDNLSTGYRENLEGVGGTIQFAEGDAGEAATVAPLVKGCDYVFH